MTRQLVVLPLTIVAVATGGLLPAVADARRSATRTERAAIDRALPKGLRTAKCSRIVVSTVDRDYAAVTGKATTYGGRCAVGNGYLLAVRDGSSWTIDYGATQDERCSVAARGEDAPPARVLRDLRVCR